MSSFATNWGRLAKRHDVGRLGEPQLSDRLGVSIHLATDVRPLHCAQRILRYVINTKDRRLLHRTIVAEQLIDYMDINWAGSPSDRQSKSGYAFSLGSAVISWCSKKQSTLALLSTEVEYKGAIVATCEAIWLNRLLKDL